MPPQKLPAFLADAAVIDGSLSGVSSLPFLEEWWNSNTRMRYPEICGGMTYDTHGLAGFEHHTEFPAVVEAMVKHGYSTTDIVKIVGANWMRVFRAAWRD